MGVTKKKPPLPYDQWKKALMHDKDFHPGILSEIPEFVLVEWWEDGIEPAFCAILKAVETEKLNPFEKTG